jgi:hypothetical protein
VSVYGDIREITQNVSTGDGNDNAVGPTKKTA